MLAVVWISSKETSFCQLYQWEDKASAARADRQCHRLSISSLLTATKLTWQSDTKPNNKVDYETSWLVYVQTHFNILVLVQTCIWTESKACHTEQVNLVVFQWWQWGQWREWEQWWHCWRWGQWGQWWQWHWENTVKEWSLRHWSHFWTTIITFIIRWRMILESWSGIMDGRCPGQNANGTWAWIEVRPLFMPERLVFSW